MVVNKTKTEIMIMAKSGMPAPQSIIVDSSELQVQQTMKVLGIVFDHQMSWIPQMDAIVKRANKMASGLRVIGIGIVYFDSSISYFIFYMKFY